MKKFTIKNLEFVTAGHEDPQNPGVVKKVIFTANDVEINGTVQMINWCQMKPGKSFARHYHEYMDEIFIILSGQAEITIDQETAPIEATDTVFIPQQAQHEMKNIGTEDVVYIAMGVVTKPGGKTVIVDKSE